MSNRPQMCDFKDPDDYEEAIDRYCTELEDEIEGAHLWETDLIVKNHKLEEEIERLKSNAECGLREIDIEEVVKIAEKIKEVDKEIEENNKLMCKYPAFAETLTKINMNLSSIEATFIIELKKSLNEEN